MFNIKDMKVSKKLLLSFSVITVLMLCVGIIGFINMGQMVQADSELYFRVVRPLGEIEELSRVFGQVRSIVIHTGDSEDEAQISDLIEQRKELSRTIAALVDSLRPNFNSSEGQRLLARFNEKRALYLEKVEALETMSLSKSPGRKQVLSDLSSTADGELQAIKAMADLKVQRGSELSERNSDLASGSRILIAVFTLVGIILAAVFALYITKIITSSLSKLYFIASELQKGHVRYRANIDSRDEIGIAGERLDKFTEQLEAFAGAMHAIANGDVSITVPAYDSEDVLAPALNAIASTLRNLLAELNKVIGEAMEGSVYVRGDAAKFDGGYKEIMNGINSTIKALIDPVEYSYKTLDAMAKGDFTVRMNGCKGDYIKFQNNVNTLAESMEQAMRDFGASVHATASAANEISASSEQMSSGAQEQAQQTVEIASAVEEMTKTIMHATQSANDAAQLSRVSQETAARGETMIRGTKEGMNKIVESSSKAADVVSSLAARTEQIGEITQVIDDIADQTNLLALNAALEAARAGEQGRGFAVVADEVRKLAERTTKATKEIADTVKSIQEEAKVADDSMEESKGHVTEGMKMTEEVEKVLKEILDHSVKTNNMAMQVAAASEQQSAAAEQISKNIEGISGVSQQSAAGVEQIARAAEDMNRLTVNLQQIIGKFRFNETRVYGEEKRLSASVNF
ncbi:MAG: methyl-accepting chemotaxis protein [Bacteroidota bacterium]